MMKSILAAALVLPIGIFACGDEVAPQSAPAATTAPPPSAFDETGPIDDDAGAPPPAGEPMLNDIDDPSVAAECAARSKIVSPGSYTADEVYGVNGANSIVAYVSDYDHEDLVFDFSWAATKSLDPVSGWMRGDGLAEIEVLFTDPDWQTKLAPNATFPVTIQLEGYSSWCAQDGSGGEESGDPGGALPVGLFTVTAKTATSISGKLAMKIDGAPDQVFTFESSFVPDPSSVSSSSSSGPICCLKTLAVGSAIMPAAPLCAPAQTRGTFTADDRFSINGATDLVATNSNDSLVLVANWPATFDVDSTGAPRRTDKVTAIGFSSLGAADSVAGWFEQLQMGATLPAWIAINGPTGSSCTATTPRDYGEEAAAAWGGQLTITARSATSISGTFTSTASSGAPETFTFEAPIVDQSIAQAPYPAVCCLQ